MMFQNNSRRGFTLIEMVAVLILSSAVIVMGAMLLSTATRIFVADLATTEDSQKAQAAMNRLVKELTWAKAGSIMIDSDRRISWISYHSDRVGAGRQTASWNGTSGSELSLQGVPLLDNLGSFRVATGGSYIDISLSSARSANIIHSTRIHPRYDE